MGGYKVGGYLLLLLCGKSLPLLSACSHIGFRMGFLPLFCRFTLCTCFYFVECYIYIYMHDIVTSSCEWAKEKMKKKLM